MVISIRKKILMGYLPWIIFRGIIAFGLLSCGLVFTINQLKGDVFDRTSLPDKMAESYTGNLHIDLHANLRNSMDTIKGNNIKDINEMITS